MSSCFQISLNKIQHIGGTLMLSCAVVLGAIAGTHFLREALQAQVVRGDEFHQISQQLIVPLAPSRYMTDMPLHTAAATHPRFENGSSEEPKNEEPLPVRDPVRLSISSIDLNSNIVEVSPEQVVNGSGELRWQWAVADHAVGHQKSGSSPGSTSNIVLTGHNNTQGEVFRRLPEVAVGDVITLYTANTEHQYVVQEREIVPYRSDPINGERAIKRYSAPTQDERLTLLSCYPYSTNADRIVLVAKPVEHVP